MAESPITSREKDFATWYQDVVLAGDMAEPAEIVKGCMVIKPNGYAVWEKLQRELDDRFKATGHQNIYLPLLIPQSFLKKEAEHVEGFSPELAVVTHAGGVPVHEMFVPVPAFDVSTTKQTFLATPSVANFGSDSWYMLIHAPGVRALPVGTVPPTGKSCSWAVSQRAEFQTSGFQKLPGPWTPPDTSPGFAMY